MTHHDNLDRLPTKFERFLGAAASLLIFAFTGAIVAFGVFGLLRHPEKATIGIVAVLCGLAMLALWAVRMFVRVIRGTPQKPSPLARFIAGLVAALFGAVYLCALAVTSLHSGNDIPVSGYTAAITLVSGVLWSHHAWRQLRSREA